MAISQQISEEYLYRFFEAQVSSWQDFAHRIENLGRTQTRRLFHDQTEIDIQYNPSRITSSQADICPQAIGQRPCFLCGENQPKEQKHQLLLGKYLLAVNPYPILQYHFTLSSKEHSPQNISNRMEDLCLLALNHPSFVLFYNGAYCGASAPDHMHFQMGRKGQIPLQYNCHALEKSLSPIFTIKEEGIYLQENHIFPYIVIRSKSPGLCQKLFNRLSAVLPVKENHAETDINILAWKAEDMVEVCIIPRSKHRPACYDPQGKKGFCISPGCVDMGGLVITPLSDDFHRINAEQAIGILQEVACKNKDIETWTENLLNNFRNSL